MKIVTKLKNNKEGNKRLYFLKYIYLLKFKKEVKYWRISDLSNYPYIIYSENKGHIDCYMYSRLGIEEPNLLNYEKFLIKFLDEK